MSNPEPLLFCEWVPLVANVGGMPRGHIEALAVGRPAAKPSPKRCWASTTPGRLPYVSSPLAGCAAFGTYPEVGVRPISRRRLGWYRHFDHKRPPFSFGQGCLPSSPTVTCSIRERCGLHGQAIASRTRANGMDTRWSNCIRGKQTVGGASAKGAKGFKRVFSNGESGGLVCPREADLCLCPGKGFVTRPAPTPCVWALRPGHSGHPGYR